MAMVVMAMMMVVAMVPIVAWRAIIVAGAGNPGAGLYPAKAVPDWAADRADVLDEIGSAGFTKTGASRQRQGFCAAGNKR
jgi:hypothetical protein